MQRDPMQKPQHWIVHCLGYGINPRTYKMMQGGVHRYNAALPANVASPARLVHEGQSLLELALSELKAAMECKATKGFYDYAAAGRQIKRVVRSPTLASSVPRSSGERQKAAKALCLRPFSAAGTCSTDLTSLIDNLIYSTSKTTFCRMRALL